MSREPWLTVSTLFHLLKSRYRFSKMVHQVRALVAKSGDVNLISGTHMVEGEKQVPTTTRQTNKCKVWNNTAAKFRGLILNESLLGSSNTLQHSFPGWAQMHLSSNPFSVFPCSTWSNVNTSAPVRRVLVEPMKGLLGKKKIDKLNLEQCYGKEPRCRAEMLASLLNHETIGTGGPAIGTHGAQLLVTIRGLMVHLNWSHQSLCTHWAMLEAQLHVTCWQTPKSHWLLPMRGLITMMGRQEVTSGIWTPRRPCSQEANSYCSIKSAWANLPVPCPGVGCEYVLWFTLQERNLSPS